MKPDEFDDLCKNYLIDHPEEMIETFSVCSASYYLYYNGIPGQVAPLDDYADVLIGCDGLGLAIAGVPGAFLGSAASLATHGLCLLAGW